MLKLLSNHLPLSKHLHIVRHELKITDSANTYSRVAGQPILYLSQAISTVRA